MFIYRQFLQKSSEAWGQILLCFIHPVSFLRRICTSECFEPGYIHWANLLALFERDRWRGLTSEDNESRKILLNPAHQCKAQGFIKVFVLKELYHTSTGKQKNPAKITQKRKAVIIKRHFNLKYINKCTMNSQ